MSVAAGEPVRKRAIHKSAVIPPQDRATNRSGSRGAAGRRGTWWPTSGIVWAGRLLYALVPRVPERIQWAVELLDVGPADEILEIGCGNGVAVELVCDALTAAGHLTAIDRSDKAIARARQRNAHHIESGRLTLDCSDLAGCSGAGAPFDKIFAVNVNVFWAEPATCEIKRLSAILRPGGWLGLVYEAPDPERMRDELAPRIAERLRSAGLDNRLLINGRLCASSAEWILTA